MLLFSSLKSQTDTKAAGIYKISYIMQLATYRWNSDQTMGFKSRKYID